MKLIPPPFYSKTFCTQRKEERGRGEEGADSVTTQHSVALVFGPWLSEYNQIRLPLQPGGRVAKLSPSVFGLAVAHTNTHTL